VLAEEVVLLGGRQRGVAIGRADHAELVGVGPEPLLEHQPVLQRLAGVFVGKHLGRLRLGHIEVAGIPGLVVGEGVVGREQGMSLAITLDLRRLVHRLPLRPLLDVGRIQRAAGVLRIDREHEAVGEVAVVRERQHRAAGRRLVVLQPLVEVERIGAANRGLRREGHDLPGLCGAVPEDDVAVQVVAVDQ
jgi:hypothetical protein